MQGCEQAMAVMLAKLPTRPFAGMTQIRFKGFGLRHLSPHGTPLGLAPVIRHSLFDYNAVNLPGIGDVVTFKYLNKWLLRIVCARWRLTPYRARIIRGSVKRYPAGPVVC